jgi:hypothetical protein|tara:strand:- start:259 stop:489 length:231 start_codon:yes stop_codon:yes gene_type:complete
MKKFVIEVKVGDEIEVGKFRNVLTKIKAIEFDEHGQPVVVTSKGKKKLLSCRLSKLNPGNKTPNEILADARRKKIK